jgi:glycosyltransferase involved in cell wall biosynthesis
VAVVSFRLGERDGVSVTASLWAKALRRLGFQVRTLAGEGDADHLLPELAMQHRGDPLSPDELEAALTGADLVVVENVCSLPLNPQAARVLAERLRGRPAVLHHHDLPWQRDRFREMHGWPPDDPAWVHVTINDASRRDLAARGIRAVTVYHGFSDGPPGRRASTRRRLRIPPGRILLLQPTRAIPRKNVRAGVALAEALGATYWLTGPAEDGYGPELRRILAGARCGIRRGLTTGLTMADAYAAADAIVLPSSWEGFGCALIESAVYSRPLAVSSYPVALEMARFGFRWFPVDDPQPLRSWLDRPDMNLIEHNRLLARRHFSLDALAAKLASLLQHARESRGWEVPAPLDSDARPSSPVG